MGWAGGAARGGLYCLGELGVADGGFNNGFGHLAAFAALGGHAEFAPDITERACAAKDSFLDLAVGYSFAEADVHGVSGINGSECWER